MFGHRVSAAGDIDADGYGDVWVTENPWLDGRDGVPTVKLFPGRATGLAERPTMELISDRNDQFGAALEGGRDINGDGVPDVVVGGARDDAMNGAVVVFLSRAGRIPSRGLSVESTSYPGGTPSLWFSRSLCMSDFDGDGFADIVASEDRHLVVLFGGTAGLRLPATIRVPVTVSAFAALSDRAPFGDALDDLVVAVPEMGDSFETLGRVHTLIPPGPPQVITTGWGRRMRWGGASLAGVGDENGDGRDDFVAFTGDSLATARLSLVYQYSPAPAVEVPLPPMFRALGGTLAAR
jgi:hypothetical protein